MLNNWGMYTGCVTHCTLAITIALNEPEIKKIYQLIDEPYYPHKFENLQQLNINGIGYDDTELGKDMHTIRSTIQKIPNPYKDRIPKVIREKYGHIKF